MYSADVKFLGLANREYLFTDEKGTKIRFSKCRKELINSFQLDEPTKINTWFCVSYIKTKPLNKYDSAGETLIISDMRPL